MFSVVSFMACTSTNNKGQESEQVPEANVFKTELRSTQIVQSYPGNVEGKINVDIRAQVSGYLEHIYVEEGGYVAKGQPLFKIDDQPLLEQLNSAKANLKSAEAGMLNARIEVDKLTPLVQGKVVKDIQLQSAKASYAAAVAQAEQAKAAVETARINLNFTLIKAPVSGFIGRIPKRIGNLISASDSQPLTSLSDISSVNVYFSVSESDYLQFLDVDAEKAPKQRVLLTLADGTTYAEEGKLSLASGEIDNATGALSMKAVFDNPKNRLRSGSRVKVAIQQEVSDAMLIPQASTKDIQNRNFVLALNDSGKVAMKPISIINRSGNNYLVKGIDPGETIVWDGLDQLQEGMTVKAKIIPLSKALEN